MFFRRIFADPDAREPRDPQDLARRFGVPAPDQPRELVLYKFDSCPYCRRVLQVVDETGVVLDMRDTIVDRGARQDLVRATGRTQVPCLFVDGQPLFESSDIAEWLRSYARFAGGSAS